MSIYSGFIHNIISFLECSKHQVEMLQRGLRGKKRRIKIALFNILTIKKKRLPKFNNKITKRVEVINRSLDSLDH